MQSYPNATHSSSNLTANVNMPTSLGVMLKKLGRLDEAEVSYRQVIVLKPNYVGAHSNLGRLLLKKGQHREGLNEILIGDGFISFDLKSGLSI